MNSPKYSPTCTYYKFMLSFVSRGNEQSMHFFLHLPQKRCIRDMAKRFRLRISRLLHSCRSNDSITHRSDPVPSFLRLPLQTDLPPGSRRSFLSCRVPPSSVPYGCVCGCGCGSRSPGVGGTVSHEFHWKQEADFHALVAAATTAAPRRKIYFSSASEGGGSAWAPQWERRKRRTRNRKRKPKSFRQRVSTSSGDYAANPATYD